MRGAEPGRVACVSSTRTDLRSGCAWPESQLHGNGAHVSSSSPRAWGTRTSFKADTTPAARVPGPAGGGVSLSAAAVMTATGGGAGSSHSPAHSAGQKMKIQ